ncbi:MAG TPA: RsmE family RNA methyltransferase [Candidatus Dojkabacteria bacterium]|nr:RsmE family RNA methyltransferase [Candidatus Dojkabacteria bacterium]HQF37134.1 RsmE family RNA methyltransferase [Candidatus Dojkabacteria bacterium]
MFRFFTEKQEIKDNTLYITKESDIHHIIHVLRLQIGNEIEVVSNNNVYLGKILNFNDNKIKIQIINKSCSPQQSQNQIRINLFQSIIKPSNFELICEKCTEIGITSITPIVSQHSQFAEEVFIKKNERFNKICEVASKQSKRTTIPKVNNPITLKQIELINTSLNIIFDNTDSSSSQSINYSTFEEINYFIGPEGGWGINDHEIFKTFPNMLKISLDGNILRAETASIVGLTIIKIKANLWKI